ncbi:MAG: CGGC domain-containing protein, partial [Planctomycetota bacterium]|nr:CGGC domain-containing protein [Planctomycetota bacterium]
MESVVVHLSTCIVRPSHHGPRCPHLEYLREQVARAGLAMVEGTRISRLAESRRSGGEYRIPGRD